MTPVRRAHPLPRPRLACRAVCYATLVLLTGLASGCAGDADVPSTLDTRGPGAAEIAWLWWLMLGLGTAVFLLVVALLVWASLRPAPERGPRWLFGAGDGFVGFWGIAVTGVILTVVLTATITVGARTYWPATTPTDVTVEVIGHKFWWEVRYDGEDFVTANEIHIPAGEPVTLRLESVDVIHAFWVPQLHGKMDMVPGHTNEFWIQADEPGTFRGLCAEYCGLQHAKMQFEVIASEPDEFEEWLANQREPAVEVEGTAAEGREVYDDANCIGCHAIEGHFDEEPRRGPDLTHFADRQMLGAAIAPNTREELADWIENPHDMKPGVRMPPTALDDDDLEALLDYLEALE